MKSVVAMKWQNVQHPLAGELKKAGGSCCFRSRMIVHRCFRADEPFRLGCFDTGKSKGNCQRTCRATLYAVLPGMPAVTSVVPELNS